MAKTYAEFQHDIDVATQLLANATADAQSKLSDLNRCNCGKGKLILKGQGYPAGTCTPLTDVVVFPNLADVAHCIQPPNVNNCKTDCCSQSTCTSRVNAYNGAIGVYNTAVLNLKNANDALKNAATNDPNVANEIANRKTRNGILYIVAIVGGLVVLAIAGVLLWKKYGQ